MQKDTVKQNSTKRPFVWLVRIIITMFLVFLGFAIPLNLSDGTEKFEGDEYLAAKAALESDRNAHHGKDYISILGALNTYVPEVKQVDTGRGCNNSFTAAESKVEAKFKVTIGYRTLFGLPLLIHWPEDYICSVNPDRLDSM